MKVTMKNPCKKTSGHSLVSCLKFFILFIIFFHPHLLKCQSIATHLQGNSFCAGYEIRFTFSIPPVTFGSGNLFIAQLSDESGNFASPVNIDTLQRVDPDTIVGLVPFNTPAGYG
ncbi:MAG: hypothetical protein KKD31_03645, partial [Bacteroidetes bacterium]|nr:hypothetical protein [Bacteroidota bacterium]